MIAAFALAMVWAGGAIGSLPPADKLEVQASVMAGSGASVTGSGGTTLFRPSPLFLSAEVGFRHPALPWLEFAPTLMLEVQGRVGFAIDPKLRALLRWSRVELFALLGLPIFVVPYSLVGVQAGGGLAFRLHRHFAIVGEFSGSAFVWGSDLTKGSALGKFDGTAGVRVHF